MTLLTIKLSLGGERFEIPYESIDVCARDGTLARLLEHDKACCAIWAGALCVTGTLETMGELRAALFENERTISYRLRGRASQQ